MIDEDNILISELKLLDLQNLAEILIKAIKLLDGDQKKSAKDTLSEVVGFINKALKNEIITTYQYSQTVFNAFGGRDKAIEHIENDKRRKEELAKRPKRIKSDKQ